MKKSSNRGSRSMKAQPVSHKARTSGGQQGTAGSTVCPFGKYLLPLAAIVVVVAALLTVVAPGIIREDPGEVAAEPVAVQMDAGSVTDGSAMVINADNLGTEASFYSYDADGVTVELFAVEAPDGSIRLALNTCQVCNGSPYAYFVQEGDDFVCQNCHNRFSVEQVGVVSGGCNPVPITESDYSQQDGSILIPLEFLENNAGRFVNWKKF